MQIKVDKEGLKAIHALCDVALKVGGLQNLKFVNDVLFRTSVEEPKQEEPK